MEMSTNDFARILRAKIQGTNPEIRFFVFDLSTLGGVEGPFVRIDVTSEGVIAYVKGTSSAGTTRLVEKVREFILRGLPTKPPPIRR